jgi:hypothetical protein
MFLPFLSARVSLDGWRGFCDMLLPFFMKKTKSVRENRKVY